MRKHGLIIMVLTMCLIISNAALASDSANDSTDSRIKTIITTDLTRK